jgi:hypothetical protein
MKLHEALSKSNKVRRKEWLLSEYFNLDNGYRINSRGDEYIILPPDIKADDWEPILEKKKMYQALLRYENGSYYITPFLYPDEAAAKEVYNNFFVKLLTDRPIEVEDV